jgi:Peptidase family M23
LAAISLRRVTSCLGVHGDYSVRTDLFPYGAEAPTHSLRAVLARMAKDCLPYIEEHELLALDASARITDPDLAVDPGGYRHTISLDVQLTNLTNETVTVYDHQVLVTDSGGWVHMSSPLYGQGSPLVGQSNYVPAGQKQTGTFPYSWAAGPFNVVITIWAQAGPRLQQIVRRVPILRDGYPAPPVIQVPAPVYIGLWARPAEVLDVWHGGHKAAWLSLAGHIVNVSRSDITVDSWKGTIYSNGTLLLERDLLQEGDSPPFYRPPTGDGIGPDEEGTIRLPPLPVGGFPSVFVEGFELKNLPADLSKTTLKLVLNYRRFVGSGLQKGRAVCVAPLARIKPAVLASPVRSPSSGTWRWGNAPDKKRWDAHIWAAERYCYDLGVVDASGKTYAGDCIDNADGTHSGACTENSNFFDYGLPVYAAADGTVRLAIDTVDENFGKNANASPSAKGNNWVVIEHPDHTISGYYHLRKGRNKVKVGNTISAGTQVGEVGNAGGSSEPHLHFGHIKVHATGRGVNAPTAFSNLKTSSGEPVPVVPGLGLYES